MAGRGLDSAARVLRGPTIDRERHRSCALDDHQEPPHRGETRRTDDPGRCPGVPSLLASDTKCRQKTESLFAKAFKSLLQQNRHKASFRTDALSGRYWDEADIAGFWPAMVRSLMT